MVLTSDFCLSLPCPVQAQHFPNPFVLILPVCLGHNDHEAWLGCGLVLCLVLAHGPNSSLFLWRTTDLSMFSLRSEMGSLDAGTNSHSVVMGIGRGNAQGQPVIRPDWSPCVSKRWATVCVCVLGGVCYCVTCCAWVQPVPPGCFLGLPCAEWQYVEKRERAQVLSPQGHCLRGSENDGEWESGHRCLLCLSSTCGSFQPFPALCLCSQLISEAECCV